MDDESRSLLKTAALKINDTEFIGKGALERVGNGILGVFIARYETFNVTKETELKQKIDVNNPQLNTGLFQGEFQDSNRRVEAKIYIEQTFSDDSKQGIRVRLSVIRLLSPA